MTYTQTSRRWFRLDRHDDRLTVRNADEAVHDLLIRYRAASAEARTAAMADDSLHDEARTAAISDAVAALRQQYGAELAGIDGGVRRAVDALKAAFDRQLPKPQTGVEALLTRQAWFARAQTLLKSNLKIRDVINTATDPEMLFALRDELPTMVASGQVDFQGGLPTGLTQINARLARLSGQPAVDAMEAADDAQEGLNVLEPVLQRAANEIGATDHRVTSQADFAAALDQLGVRLRPRR